MSTSHDNNQPITPRDIDVLMAFVVLTKHQMMVCGADKYGLTPTQAFTLMHIQPDNPRPMSYLCESFGCDASNMTGIIDGLEQKHLVSRQSRATDRRIKEIRLEPAGLQIRQAITEGLMDRNNALFSKLTTAECITFAQLLRRIIS